MVSRRFLTHRTSLGRDSMSTDHTSAIGAMAAGRLLAMATGGRWGPTILILAAIILLRRRAAVRAASRALPGRQGADASDTSD